MTKEINKQKTEIMRKEKNIYLIIIQTNIKDIVKGNQKMRERDTHKQKTAQL